MTASSNSKLHVISVEPTTDARWLALQESSRAKIFHSVPWLRALSETYSVEIKSLLAINDIGEVRGGLLFCALDGILGQRLVSLPYTDTCDPLLEDEQAWSVIFDRLRDTGAPLYFRCLDDEIVRADPHLQIVKRARWHTLSLNEPEDILFDRFDGSVRRAIRKAEGAKVIIKPLKGHDLSAFHRLHVILRKRKYRLLAQPLAFFESLRKQFGATNDWFPLGAFVNDRLVAATIFLRCGDTLYYKFNTSRIDDLTFRPNNLLVWEGIKLAKSLGCTKLDFGPSDDDQPGLIRFKKQFSAVERELRFLGYIPPNWNSGHTPRIRHALGKVTRLLTLPQVPDCVTKQAGTYLYRLFA